jgi:hypothetical protein
MLNSFKSFFNKNKKRPKVINVETAPLPEDQLRALTRESVQLTPSHFLVGCAQSVGRQ